MKKNSKINSKFKSKNVNSTFTGTQLTRFSGLSPIMKYLNKMKLGQQINEIFPTKIHNSTKFTDVQIFMTIILASFVGISRLIKIATFTYDSLVMALLGLNKELNKDVIGTRLKQLGQGGAIKLHEYLFTIATRWLAKSKLESITLDVDSTVKTVYGNQQGSAKGYNPHKPGAKSYHPLLAFVSEMKLVLNSWFRTGSCYTSNGICEFIKQTKAIIPTNVEQVFFRADSGFFSGELFDLLESYHWTYLVKVKLKNLKQLLEAQSWHILKDDPSIAICEFSFKGKGWKKKRTLKAIRTITEWVEVEFIGKKQLVPKYEYACYCSSLWKSTSMEEKDALSLHELYNQRSTSETWIEQVKSQLLAGTTLTDNFHANDILWQLSVFAYNLSVMMRYNMKNVWKQEHATFRDWFINLPAKLVKSGRQIKMKIYKNYYYKNRWIDFEQFLLLSG